MTEEINRAPQELDSRENTKRPNDSWVPASSLPSLEVGDLSSSDRR